MEGNCGLINNFLSKKIGHQPKVAFFGDQYTSDVHWASSVDNWHGIAVIEEMSWAPDFGLQDDEKTDFHLIPYEKYWGADYFMHDPQNPVKNYFVHECSKTGRYAVAQIKYIKHLM